MLLILLFFSFLFCINSQTVEDITKEYSPNESKTIPLPPNSKGVYWAIQNLNKVKELSLTVEQFSESESKWIVKYTEEILGESVNMFDVSVDENNDGDYRFNLTCGTVKCNVFGMVLDSPKTRFYVEFNVDVQLGGGGLEKLSSRILLFSLTQYFHVQYMSDESIALEVFKNSGKIAHFEDIKKNFQYQYADSFSTIDRDLFAVIVSTPVNKSISLTFHFRLSIGNIVSSRDTVQIITDVQLPPVSSATAVVKKHTEIIYFSFQPAVTVAVFYKNNEVFRVESNEEVFMNGRIANVFDIHREYTLKIINPSTEVIRNVNGFFAVSGKTERLTVPVPFEKMVTETDPTWIMYFLPDVQKVEWALNCSKDVDLALKKYITPIKKEVIYENNNTVWNEVKTFEYTKNNEVDFILIKNNKLNEDLNARGVMTFYLFRKIDTSLWKIILTVVLIVVIVVVFAVLVFVLVFAYTRRLKDQKGYKMLVETNTVEKEDLL